MQATIEGLGEVNVICSPYTLKVYEQAFHSPLIADVFGKVDLEAGKGDKSFVTASFVKQRLLRSMPKPKDGGAKKLPKNTEALVDKAFPVTVTTVFDYTREHWDADLRCLWAMLKTAEKKAQLAGGYPANPTPDYDAWLMGIDAINMNQVADVVGRECADKLFRA